MPQPPPTLRANIAGDGSLAGALRARGVADGGPDDALVLDRGATDPGDWEQLEAVLVDAFELSRQAAAAGVPVVYVLHGPSLHGHAPPLRASLATGLLGGVRSIAAEGERAGVPAHAVTVGDGPADAEAATDAIVWLLSAPRPTGQLIRCDNAHVGRPAP